MTMFKKGALCSYPHFQFVELANDHSPRVCPRIQCEPPEFLGSASRASCSNYRDAFNVERYSHVPTFLQAADIFTTKVAKRDSIDTSVYSSVALPLREVPGRNMKQRRICTGDSDEEGMEQEIGRCPAQHKKHRGRVRK